jgi:Fanconi anemia group M protein
METELMEELAESQDSLKEYSEGISDTDESGVVTEPAEVEADVERDTDGEDESPSVTDSETVEVIADSRETSSSVVKELDRMVDVEVRTVNNLEVGDYIIGDMAVERKSVQDFIDTITGDRSVFEQVGEILGSYDQAAVIIEGEKEELYTRNVHENSIRGVMSSLSVDFNASVMHTVDERDTAYQIASLARRSQAETEAEVSAHGKKETDTLAEQQEYIVSSIEDIGPKKAKALLSEFGSVKSIVVADKSELTDVAGIGEGTADTIHSVLRADYDPVD